MASSWKTSLSRQALAAIVALLSAAIPVSALKPPPEATVSARKGPIQLTLRVYKKRVKVKHALWYQLELKNVGKEKIKVDDKIFRDPWAIYENIHSKYGIYLEAIDDSDGESAAVRNVGAGEVSWDYITELKKRGQLGPKDMAALNAAKAEWDRKGLTGRAREDALSDWNMKFRERNERAEDERKEFWLPPGASTRTFAWAYTNDKEPTKRIPNPKEFWDIEKQVGDYTQLWSYEFFDTGKYRVRAVYRNDLGEWSEQLRKKHGLKRSPWEVEVETPFITFQVLK